MKLSNYIKYLLLSFLLSLAITGCSWLDVNPQSEIEEDELFSLTSGFEDALINVYLKVSDKKLYGQKLSFYEIELLAQQYKPNVSNTFQADLSEYNFTSSQVMSSNDAIFSNMYNAIANCNKLIEKAEESTLAFQNNRRELILGEALALRAWMHFDLLRLFSPSYISDPDYIAFPYVTKLNYEPKQRNTALEVAGFVLQDLNDALAYLEESDPILSGEESDNLFESDRESRMNVFAVKALLARVHLYLGNYNEALTHSVDVINTGQYEFMAEARVAPEADYLFYPELIFTLNANTLLNDAQLLFVGDNILSSRNIVDQISAQDIRRLWFDDINLADPTFLRYIYQDPNVRSFVPMIKLGEMVLIAAECATKTLSPEEGLMYLNQIRIPRGKTEIVVGTDTWTMEDVLMEIQNEYRVEFFGEGQLFYFYKRINAPTIEGPTGVFIEMSDEKYTLPIPINEIDFGSL